MSNAFAQDSSSLQPLKQVRDLIQSEQYEAACQQLEQLTQQPSGNPSEWYYRLGNLFYEAQAPERAQQLWEKSVTFSYRVPQSSVQPLLASLRRLIWNTIGLSILAILSMYLLILLLFPRQMNMWDMFMMAMNAPGSQTEEQEPLTLWDQFWNNTRPSTERSQYLTQEQTWDFLKQQLERVFSDDKPVVGSAEEQWIDWLYRMRYEQSYRSGPLDYHLLVGRGLFNMRNFDEAIAMLEQGIEKADNPIIKGTLYQELATTYYYQGYRLQPDGLAKYDLELVRKSVEAYEQAGRYLEDSYLYGNLGWGYYLLEDYPRAIHYGEKALMLNSQLNYVQMNLGITYLRMNNYDKSFAAYREVVDRSPDFLEYEGGLRDLQELIRDLPGEYPFAHFIFGYIYHQQGNYRKAQEAFQEFLRYPFPDHSWKSAARQILSNMQSG